MPEIVREQCVVVADHVAGDAAALVNENVIAAPFERRERAFVATICRSVKAALALEQCRFVSGDGAAERRHRNAFAGEGFGKGWPVGSVGAQAIEQRPYCRIAHFVRGEQWPPYLRG